MVELRTMDNGPAGYSLRALLARHAIRTGLIPTLVFVVFLLGSSIAVILWISHISQEDLVCQARMNLALMTTQKAANLSECLRSIRRQSELFQAEAAQFLRHPDDFPLTSPAPRLTHSPKGILYKEEDNGGASALYFCSRKIDETERAHLLRSERLDRTMACIRASSPNVVLVWFMTDASLLRMYPWQKDLQEKVDPDLDVSRIMVYYEADGAHNPSRGPRWTNVYLDHVGYGWMVTCTAPLYDTADRMRGVVGIDLTVGHFEQNLADRPAYVHPILVDRNRNIIYTTPALERKFGLSALKARLEPGHISEAFVFPDEFNLLKSPVIGLADEIQRALAAPGEVHSVQIGGERQFLCASPVGEADWTILFVGDESELLAAAQMVQRTSMRLTYALITLASGFLVFLLFHLVRRARSLGQTIQESETRLATILEQSPISMAIVGLDGTIEYFNRKAFATFGYLPADIPTMDHWWRLAYPDPEYRREAVATWTELTAKALSDRREIEGREYRVTCKDGSVKTMFIFGVPVVGKVFVMFEDVTARKQAEAALRESEARLRHAEKMDAIGQLAGGVAHDFNNQLSGILGYAELLVRRLNDPASCRFAEGIRTAALRAADLTAQLLGFARKGKILCVPVDLHAVIREVVELLRHSIDKRIEIRQALKAAPSLTRGDPTQLQSALLNLALNARDAMPEGGELSFTTAVADHQSDSRSDLPSGRYVRVHISDTGTGMSEEVRKHLFEPFFTTKAPGKGTGLGLASVYGIVKNHGGSVEVESALGRGTTVAVLLPLHEAPVVPPDVHSTAAPREGARILLVDDEEVVRDTVSQLLTDLGYAVIVCANGEQAVREFESGGAQVDLVLLDMMMPKMNGGDTWRALRRLRPGVSVLLCSGYSIGEETQAILDEGALGFIQKPIQAAELARKVAEALHTKA